MQDAPGESSNLHKSSAGSFTSGTWPTRWAYDAVDEMEVVEDRVFWQASQTKDPVLNQLLSDAHRPQKRSLPAHCPDLLKSWSPSPGSITSDTTSSTLPLKAAARRQRPTKRKLQSAATVTQLAVPSAEPSSIAKQLLEWTKKLPDISKKVDEDAMRRVKELKEMQRNKRRKAARISRNGVSKRYGSSSTGKKERRIPDSTHEEEEMSGVEGSIHEHRKHNGNTHNDEEIPPSGSTRLMPPPSSFHHRKPYINGGKSLLMVNNAHEMPDLTHPYPHNVDASIDGPSFSSSFVETSTPKPFPGPYSKLGPLSPNVLLVTRNGKDDTTNNVRPSVLSAASNPTKTDRTVHDPGFENNKTAKELLDHNTHLNNSPPLLMPFGCVPIHQPTQSLAMPSSKTNGPRPLGMRRTMNGQTPSLSQGLSSARSSEKNLPVKQSGFKVPFAKQKPAGAAVLAGTGCQPQPLLASDSYTANGTRGWSSSCLHTAPVACGQKDVSAAIVKPPQACLPKSERRRDTAVVKNVDVRSSPPPADADSSFDFDMSFDPDELEKACRAYD